MRKLIASLVSICIVSVGVGAAACSEPVADVGVISAAGVPREGNASDPPDASVIDAVNRFGFDLANELSVEGENTVISPVSVAAALTMAHRGAEGQAAEEMAAVLGLDGMEPNAVNNGWADLIASLMIEDGSTTVRVANSLWLQDGAPIEQEFVDANHDFFGAEIRTLDLQEAGAPAAVNAWVDEQTRGRIPEIMEEFDPLAVAEIVNAVCFLGDWARPFDVESTEDESFTLADGEVVDAQMMNAGGSWEYAEDEQTQVVRIPYEGDRYSAWVIVPGRGNAWELLTELDPGWMAEARSAMLELPGSVAMPRFELEWGEGVSLVPALAQMGMPTAFTSDADFGGISRELQDASWLYISQVAHRTYLRVDEEGTEAAAATGTEVSAGFAAVSTGPFQLRADKPFIFSIVDDRTGALVFLGVIADPR